MTRRKNLIVVQSDKPEPNQSHERVSLFKEDGSPFSSYPTFIWDTYTAAAEISISANTGSPVPIDTSPSNLVTELPEGWGFTGLSCLVVPAGVYAIGWYWDAGVYTGNTWDNYVQVAPITSVNTHAAHYPTAPKSSPASTWGYASATIRLVDDPTSFWSDEVLPIIQFFVNNRDASPHALKHTISVTKISE